MPRPHKVSIKPDDVNIIQNVNIKMPNQLKLSLVVRAIKLNVSLNDLIVKNLQDFCENTPIDKDLLKGI